MIREAEKLSPLKNSQLWHWHAEDGLETCFGHAYMRINMHTVFYSKNTILIDQQRNFNLRL